MATDVSFASAKKLSLLSLLYTVQGLPFGFQTTALPIYLATRNIPIEAIGFVSLLASPWSWKALWAPLVDATGSARFGRRRSWIVPLQALLALTWLAVSFVQLDTDGLPLLLAAVFALNLFSATMDVAVDGLAVAVLEPHELGPGNAAQVVGFKLGMVLGGGALLWATKIATYPTLFRCVALLVAAACLVTLLVREPRSVSPESAVRRSLGEIRGLVAQAIRAPNAGVVFLFLGTYKMGEAICDAMFSQYLLREAHYEPSTLGAWNGVYGMAASIAGSLLGGFVARRTPILRALVIATVLRALPLAGEWAVALLGAPPAAVITAILTEHFFGGALTTVTFAFMMTRVDPRIGGTHYTVLATVEVLGKMPGALLSGVLAKLLGFPGALAVGTGLSVLMLGVLWPLRRALSADTARPAASG